MLILNLQGKLISFTGQYEVQNIIPKVNLLGLFFIYYLKLAKEPVLIRETWSGFKFIII